MAMFGVLGPLRVVTAGDDEIVLTGARQRRLLSALLLHRGRVVPVDRLAEFVWGERVAVDTAALQSLVFRLRTRVPGIDIEFRAPGYVLTVDDEDLDAARFEHEVLTAVARRREDPVGAALLLDTALRRWRGHPYEELDDSDDAVAEASRLGELWHLAQEEHLELRLGRGDASGALAELEAHVRREPLRERPQHLLMRAYAETGRRADALRVYDTYRRLLATELGVAPSPELRHRHDELLAADDIVLAGPPHTPSSRPRPPLRRPTSSFVGRDGLLAELGHLVRSARLVTLIGPGGVGKTRLATELAHRLAGTGIEDVVFCDLAAATDRTVVDVVIGAAAVESRAEQADMDRLVEVLRHQRCCVVLDNCEHVIDQAAVVAERLVEMTDHVLVLATSRERLAVDGERLVVVPPLTLDGGTASPATRLLVDRMVAVTGRGPTPDELACLAELADRLDGLPLALELAAARLQALTVPEVLTGVAGSIAVLHGGHRTVDRHRSVEAALRWSYDLLDERDGATLRAAAAFSAPFDPDDVAALLTVDRADAVESLAVLIERSLARRDGDRVRLLHVVRTFAADRTGPSERDRLATGLASRMRHVAAELRNQLRTAVGSDPIDEYVRRVPDVRRAIEISLARHDPGTALDLVVALRDLAFNSSSFELTRWAEDAAAAGALEGHPSAVDGFAVAALGAWKRGALDEMRRLLALAEGLVEREGWAPTYELVGALATEDLARGALDRAIERLEVALRHPEIGDDVVRLAETFGTLVICMSYAHRPDVFEVADRMTTALAHARAAVARAWCQYASGECRLDVDPAAARRHLEQAVALARAGGSTFIEGIAGASLASLDVRAHDLVGAVETYRWLVPLWLRAGLRSPFWTGMRTVAELLVRAGDDDAAARLLGAVTSPAAGHELFGADAERIEALRTELLGRVGSEVFEEAFGRGSFMDDAAVAELATAAFDRLVPPTP